MNPLEVALVILVLLWTLIFIIIGLAIWFLFKSLKKVLDKMNQILDTTEEIAEGARIPAKIVMASILAFLTKNSLAEIKSLITKTLLKSRARSR